jgi:hypothetical protein
MITPILAFLLLPASAGQIKPSLTLSVLQAEAEKAPSMARSLEDSRAQASTAFTGENIPQGAPAVKAKTASTGQGPTYHFECNSPVQGVGICTPKLDSPGDDSTRTPDGSKYDWKTDYKVWRGIAIGVGVAGAVLTATGVVWAGAPLLFLAGVAAGIGLVLWFLTKKSKE